jgi:hypothetical protein
MRVQGRGEDGGLRIKDGKGENPLNLELRTSNLEQPPKFKVRSSGFKI